MSGDVLTTIKEFYKEHAFFFWLVSFIVTTLGAYYGGGWGKRARIWAVVFGRTFALNYAKKQQAWLKQLHDCDREYYRWLLTGVLWVLALLGFQLALEAFLAPPITWPLEQQRIWYKHGHSLLYLCAEGSRPCRGPRCTPMCAMIDTPASALYTRVDVSWRTATVSERRSHEYPTG
jgi:hypothetical protein